MTVNKKTDQKILKQTDQYVREMREQAQPELWRSFYDRQAQLLKEARDSSNKSK